MATKTNKDEIRPLLYCPGWIKVITHEIDNEEEIYFVQVRAIDYIRSDLNGTYLSIKDDCLIVDIPLQDVLQAIVEAHN